MKKTIFTIALLAIGINVQSQSAITETSEGKVGIGTTTPRAKLHVAGNSAVWSDFAGYTGVTNNSTTPKGKKATLVITENTSGTYVSGKGGQVTYKGGLSFGEGGSGIYSVNPNPAGSGHYGDIRFHTTAWDSSTSSYYNADRMVIKLDGNVGIGTPSPEGKLNVLGAFQVGTTANYDGGVLSTSYENGSLHLNMIEYDDPVVMNFKQTLNPDYNEKIYFNKGGFGIGISDTKGFKLGVNGKVAATEVKIATYDNWADFVFAKDYSLPSLTEVENHIKEKGHLQNIPSAAEVKKEGFFLGEMDAKLLQKIEELTLYTIQQEKQLKQQSKEIEELKILVKKLVKLKE
ncbi:conserved exported hypothetical protein [Tenacibaculum sediminilitoris]|uniref:hypothetical protein n=1 Tax=Tenacibaculum sediminilitoris TaxID=1820334 RepID=UPI003894B220